MSEFDNPDIRRAAWDNLHIAHAEALFKGIILDLGTADPALVSKKVREVILDVGYRNGLNGSANPLFDDLTTDLGGINLSGYGRDVVSHGRFIYDPEHHQLTTPYHEDPIHLTNTQAGIFYPLISQAPRLVTYERLIAFAWQRRDYAGNENSLRSHIFHIRERIELDKTLESSHIQNQPGVGYRFQDLG